MVAVPGAYRRGPKTELLKRRTGPRPSANRNGPVPAVRSYSTGTENRGWEPPDREISREGGWCHTAVHSKSGPMRFRDSTDASRLSGFWSRVGVRIRVFSRVRIRIGFGTRGSDSDRFWHSRFGFGPDRLPQVRIRIGRSLHPNPGLDKECAKCKSTQGDSRRRKDVMLTSTVMGSLETNPKDEISVHFTCTDA